MFVQTGAVIPMPVPSSFNDITSDASLQNFVGWVWYDRPFYVASDWKSKRVVLRVGSAHYNAIVVRVTTSLVFNTCTCNAVHLFDFYIVVHVQCICYCAVFLRYLLRDDLINLLKMSVREYRISSINSDTLIIRTPKFLEKIIIFCTFNNSNTLF